MARLVFERDDNLPNSVFRREPAIGLTNIRDVERFDWCWLDFPGTIHPQDFLNCTRGKGSVYTTRLVKSTTGLLLTWTGYPDGPWSRDRISRSDQTP